MLPYVEFDSKGSSGNIYFILGLCAPLLSREKNYEMCERVYGAKSYEVALSIVREYVDLVDVRRVK